MAERLTRRDFLRLAGLASAGAVVSACTPDGVRKMLEALAADTPVPTEPPTSPVPETTTETPRPTTASWETVVAPEREPKTQISYGFNTHLSANPAEGENLTLEAFKADIEQMAAMNMEAIRFNIWEWEIAHLEPYDQVIDFAREKGLAIHLVTNVPRLSPNGENLEEDLAKTRAYYTALASRWQGKINSWQIFNEADDHTYWNYSRIENAPEGQSPYPAGYLDNFGQIVKTANEVIKSIDTSTKTTVNVSLWIGSDPWLDEGRLPVEEALLFNAVEDSIDYISLDIYADTNVEAINKLPDLISNFSLVYGKPVLITELGIPTGDGRFNEQDQAEFVSLAIDAMQAGEIRPEAILLYEYRDEAMKSRTEGSFGFTDIHGNPKPALEEVLEAIYQD